MYLYISYTYKYISLFVSESIFLLMVKEFSEDHKKEAERLLTMGL